MMIFPFNGLRELGDMVAAKINEKYNLNLEHGCDLKNFSDERVHSSTFDYGDNVTLTFDEENVRITYKKPLKDEDSKKDPLHRYNRIDQVVVVSYSDPDFIDTIVKHLLAYQPDGSVLES